MPTSSQALILTKSAVSRVGSTDNACAFGRRSSVPIAKVYNITGHLPVSNININTQALEIHQKASLPIAYSSKVYFDRRTHDVKWQMVPASPTPTSDNILADDPMICYKQTEIAKMVAAESKAKARPNTAFPDKSETALAPCRTSRTFVNPFLYEALVGLGFRKNALAKDDDCVYSGFSGRKTPFPTAPTKSAIKRTSILTTDESEPMQVDNSVPDRFSVNAEKEKELIFDLESDSGSVDFDGCNRIKPSLHMREDEPEARPTAAIFSFRDNEFSSHAEVKYLIETQIGVRVKTVQFDPLDIRYSKPDVHSRWIVDFFTVPDLEKVVKKGLILGKDKLIFYRHDDIAKREVSTFKYFMKVQEAKRKLKGDKSLRKVKSAKQVHTPRTVPIRVR